MNRKKKLFIISAGLILVGFSATAVNAATTTANNVDVVLEQQENTTNDKIRYISTLELSNGVTLPKMILLRLICNYLLVKRARLH